MKFYNLKKILEYDAQYYMVIGERSNGKSFSVWDYALATYLKTGKQLAVIRRWQEDFKGKRGHEMCSGIVSEGLVKKYSNGKWNRIVYRSSRWYLAAFDENEDLTVDDKPFAYAFALSSMEHDKSTSYPEIGTILFDEFISRGDYLPNEFVLFMNVLSTIIRHRKDIKVFMLGNTVNKYCPYFDEMGIKHIKDMRMGSIDVYTYGDSDLRVAVEYCAPNKSGKDSDVYFAFDNPKLQMITGGEWEIDIYPHCPLKYKTTDIVFRYFILFSDEMLQCDIINVEHGTFTFIHRKTGDIKNIYSDIIYTPEYHYETNYRRDITNIYDNIGKIIYSYFIKDKVFYQSNDVGEVVRNYLLWCKGCNTIS